MRKILYYIIMNCVVKSFRFTGKILPAKHQVLNITKPITSVQINHGIDMRYDQESIDLLLLEKYHKDLTRKNYLYALESQRISPILKEQIAKKVIYDGDDPCLAMYLKSGGLMSGSDFDDDDFDNTNT